MEKSVSDITADETGEQTRKIIEPNYDPRYLTKVISDSVTISSKLNLNFSTGRAAEIARRLLHDHDIREAREANQQLAEKGKLARKKLEEAKKLTAMLNFNTIGCQVGEDSLKIRMNMAKKKKEVMTNFKWKKKIINERKRKYDQIQSDIRDKNLPISQLSIVQLKQLCLHKKRKDDKVSISKMKRDKLVQLWLLWKDWCDADDISAAMTKPTDTQATNESHTSIGGYITDSIVDATCDDKILNCNEDCHNVNCSENAIEYDNSIII